MLTRACVTEILTEPEPKDLGKPIPERLPTLKPQSSQPRITKEPIALLQAREGPVDVPLKSRGR